MRRLSPKQSGVLRLERTCSRVQTSKSLQPERRTPMDRYIGLDAHVSSCTFGVVGPSGKRLVGGQPIL
jgi:hypothetical protein